MKRKAPDSELASTYLLHYKTKEESLFWSFEAVDSIVRNDPEHGWNLTLALVADAPDDEALAYVAAGPLEDLLAYHGTAVIDRVEATGRRDPKFRAALGGVWGAFPRQSNVRSRVDALLGRI